jgi:hypothetical protein
MNGQKLESTPTRSVDRLIDDSPQPRMGFSAIPDPNNEMPYFDREYEDEDLPTNPSIVQERLEAAHDDGAERWPGDATPRQEPVHDRNLEDVDGARHNGIDHDLRLPPGEAAAVAQTHSQSHSRQPSQEPVEEWHRNSDDHKRDTLVTNPYEGASPMLNLPGLNDDLLNATSVFNPERYGDEYTAPSPLGHKIDEGYISQGPNKTPEIHGTRGKGVDFDMQPTAVGVEDPFLPTKHQRHLSGLSQGMQSPLYDAATGTGIDRIESKDIIALMQHVSFYDGTLLPFPELLTCSS